MSANANVKIVKTDSFMLMGVIDGTNKNIIHNPRVVLGDLRTGEVQLTPLIGSADLIELDKTYFSYVPTEEKFVEFYFQTLEEKPMIEVVSPDSVPNLQVVK